MTRACGFVHVAEKKFNDIRRTHERLPQQTIFRNTPPAYCLSTCTCQGSWPRQSVAAALQTITKIDQGIFSEAGNAVSEKLAARKAGYAETSNGRKIARMAPILTIFGRNRSRRHKLKFGNFFRAVVSLVVAVIVIVVPLSSSSPPPPPPQPAFQRRR